MPDLYLSPGEPNPNDVKLRDPAQQPSVPLAAAAGVRVAALATLGQASAEFVTAPAITIGTSAQLSIGNTLTLSAAAGITIGTDTALRAASNLEHLAGGAFAADAFAADAFDTGVGYANIFVGALAQLTAAPLLRVAATILIGVASSTLVLPADLAAAPAIRFGTGGSLTTAALLTADSGLRFATNEPRLTSVPAELSSVSAIRFGVVASLELGGLSVTNVQITFNGVPVRDRIRLNSLTITDVLNEAPNTCEFVIEGAPPAIGTEVKIGLQNVAPENLLFAGTVRRVDQYYQLRKENPAWSVSCVDYTLLLNRRKVFGSWTGISATTVAIEILTRFTSGFSTAEIAPGLPAITLTLVDADVMDALTQVANLIGGYVKPTYRKTVALFLTDPGPPPHPIDGTDPRPVNLPAITETKDETQVRNRVYVRGTASQVVGPPDTVIAAGAAELPLEEVAPFATGPVDPLRPPQVITEDAQILSYTATAPGGKAAVVVGNVPGPTSGGAPVLAAGVAGQLQGNYRWAVAYANDAGETPIGPPSASLFCPAFATPTNAPGIGATGQAGPLVGAYQYRVAFQTTLGETLPGPIASRTAGAITPAAPNVVAGPAGFSRLAPGNYAWRVTYVTPYGETPAGGAVFVTQQSPPFASVPTVNHGVPPGPLLPGQVFVYGIANVTQDGETVIGNTAVYTANGIFIPTLSSSAVLAFGGILGGPYSIAMTVVTPQGESGYLVANMGSGHFTGAPSGLQVPGNFDTSGRITPGPRYFWAASNFHDSYGETALSGSASIQTFGTTPLAIQVILPTINNANAHGIRLYRAASGFTYKLVAEFRGLGMAGQTYFDRLHDNELGDQYPRQTTPPGVSFRYALTSSAESNVLARRIYRTKAGGAEYFLVGEIQNNNAGATLTEGFFDNDLNQRVPAQGTTGRTVSIGLPIGPAGTIARRIYRSRAGGGLLFLVGEIKDNSTASWLDVLPDSALTIAAPGTSSAGSATIPRIIVPIGPGGTIARRIYRTSVNGSDYRLVGELPDNASTVFDDLRPDAARESNTPPAAAAVGETHQLTGLPIGPAGTLARIVYRTKAGGSEFFALGRVSDNTTTSFIDNVPDNQLGTDGVSLTNTAGASAVNLTSIPIGPSSVTRRVIYRTAAGGNDFRYVGTIDNNTATTFLDDRADGSLGRSPEPTSTIGALPGDLTLALDSGAALFPAPGWVKADSQYIRYTSKSGNTLTGIPATGAGAITANIRGGSSVLTAAMLTGITGIVRPLPIGSRVSIWVTCNSTAGQAALAATEGGDGIHEYVVTDPTLETIAACTKRGNAELVLFEFVQRTLTYTTRDPLTRSGAQITINLPAPQSQSGVFLIQQVRIDQIDCFKRTYPRYSVRASSTKFSLADVLRHVVLE